jgi:uncharacterized membrane protein YraQ (UPF0718 family)
MQTLMLVVRASWELFLQMAPYLLLGLFFAGILHAFVPIRFIAKHLGGRRFFSLLKAVVFGIPLPLCSCGVLPAAAMLKQRGASSASVASFLVATPMTGVDSILATTSLLGPFFSIFRVIAAAITALLTGFLVSFLSLSASDGKTKEHVHCASCCQENDETYLGLWGKFQSSLRYVFYSLVGDISSWLLVGIVVGGLVTVIFPASFANQFLGGGFLSMVIMLILGLPMYVCSTGSIPIAAAFMMKGASPGAALVFLLAGPATNAVGISVIVKALGWKGGIVFIITIAISSIGFGLLLDHICYGTSELSSSMLMPMSMLPSYLEFGSAIVLIGCMVLVFIHKLITRRDVQDV